MTVMRAFGPGVLAILLALAAQPDVQTAKPGDKGSPPKATQASPPKPDIDPGIHVAPNAAPKGPKRTKRDDKAVKPVAPAPSDPQKPGVRPL